MQSVGLNARSGFARRAWDVTTAGCANRIIALGVEAKDGDMREIACTSARVRAGNDGAGVPRRSSHKRATSVESSSVRLEVIPAAGVCIPQQHIVPIVPIVRPDGDNHSSKGGGAARPASHLHQPARVHALPTEPIKSIRPRHTIIPMPASTRTRDATASRPREELARAA